MLFNPDVGGDQGIAAATHETRTAAIALRPDIAPGLAWRVALAFDLETHGNTTWQIGTATTAGSSLLFDGDGSGEQAGAFAKLTRRPSMAPILVGHNVFTWDLPNRADEDNASLAIGLVWDTLLVMALLDPRAVSHALGDVHRTDMDAADAPPGEWPVKDCRHRAWDDLVADHQPQLANFPKDQSLAILCRGNAELDRLRELLTAVLPGLRFLKRSEILRVIRHLLR